MNLLERSLAIGIDNFMHPVEAEQLCDLACNRDVLEVGSYKGFSAWVMAITAKSVTAVDRFDAATDGQRATGQTTTLNDFIAATSRFNNVSYHQMTSVEAGRALEGQTYDLIFVDANHEYEFVREDIALWWPRVRPGGVFVGHDVGHANYPGVQRAFDEAFGPAPEGTTLVTLRWITKP